jgi:hypothetical protein
MIIDTKYAPHLRLDAPPEVPKMMRAAAIERFGGPEVLAVRSVPAPVPGPHEVLIAILANFIARHVTGTTPTTFLIGIDVMRLFRPGESNS